MGYDEKRMVRNARAICNRPMPEQEPADKGRRGGACNRRACLRRPATWYNRSTQAYYCRACGMLLNEANPDAEKMYGGPLCVEHPEAPNPPRSGAP